MSRTTIATLMGLLVAVFSAATGFAADYKEADVLLGKLKESRRSLVGGVMQAEREQGYGISGKFEMEGDELSLSVYTAQQGKGTDAEHNTLMELSGDPTKETWTPKTEVFADKEHIARASMQLTVMQESSLSLVDVIQKAEAAQPGGMVYSANPAVRHGRPVVDVLVASPENRTVQLVVDLLNGLVAPAE